MSDAQSLYDRMSDLIVARLESTAVSGWEIPWISVGTSGALPINALTRKPYRGINTLALWAAAEVTGYTSNEWGTYRQWSELGAQVLRGQHGSASVFWKHRDAETQDAAEEVTGTRSTVFARTSIVFNADQVSGYRASATLLPSLRDRIEHAETFIATWHATIERGGNRAFYNVARDVIRLPLSEQFRNAEAEVATAVHEGAHWTGHPSRLNRQLRNRFGDDEYAAEEVIAETSAAFTCARLGIAVEPREENIAYLRHWIGVMKQDSRAIFAATSKAQQATDYLFALEPAGRSTPARLERFEP